MALALTLLSINALKAQSSCTLTLRGQVVDRDSGAPLAFATVMVMDTDRGVASDIDGYFVITDICAGQWKLKVTHVGCADEFYPITLTKDLSVVLALAHNEAELNEVVIEEEISEKSVHLTRMEVRSAELDGQSGKQIAELAALIPGVRMLQTGNNIAKPVFRGLHSNRLLLLNNGIRQEGQYWGNEHAPEIDSYVAQTVAIIEGVDALRYAPDAVGGVLLIEPADVFDGGKFAGDLQTALSTNGRGGSVAGSVHGKFSEKLPVYYRFQGSLKKLGNVRTPDVFLTNTGTQEYNMSYALGYRGERWEAEMFYSIFNQEIGIYRYSHLGNLTDLYEVLNGRPAPDTSGFTYEIARPRQEILHELTKFRFQYELDADNKLELIYARQYNSRLEFDVHVGFNPSPEALARPQLDYSLTSHIGEVIWHHKLGPLSGKIGATGLFRGNKFRGRNFMPNYENRNVGVFIIESTNIRKWSIDYGMRYDWYSADIYSPVADLENPREVEFSGLAAAAAGRKSAWGGEVTISLATQWRNPAVNEQFSNGLHHGAGGIEVGNPNLELERSFNASAGWRRIFGMHKLHVVGYVNYIRDFIFLNPTNLELTIRGAFPRYDFEQADALYRGLDLQYERGIGKSATGMVRASMVWADNLSNNTFFIGVPAHRFDAVYKLNLRDWGGAKSPYIGVSGSYTMRQFRAPEVFPFENIFETGVNTPLPASFDFAPAPDGYFLLGAEAGVRFGKGAISLNLENALNNNYRDYMNRFRFFADEMGTNLTLRYKQSF